MLGALPELKSWRSVNQIMVFGSAPERDIRLDVRDRLLRIMSFQSVPTFNIGIEGGGCVSHFPSRNRGNINYLLPLFAKVSGHAHEHEHEEHGQGEPFCHN